MTQTHYRDHEATKRRRITKKNQITSETHDSTARREAAVGGPARQAHAERAREIGIRVALGASRSNIVRLVMGHGICYVAVGLVAGVAMAVGVTRLLSTMLFGLAATDAVTLGQVAVVVAAVSALACAVPTARVGRLVVSVLKAE